MSVLVSLNSLFFPVTKKSLPMTPVRYCVNGTPPVVGSPVDFNPFLNDFALVMYEEAVKAGLLRCKLIFGLKDFSGLVVHRLGHGRRMQWFEAQLCETSKKVQIGGDDYLPVFAIRYEYDHVTYVKFDLGIYRSRCSNGLIFGYKDLGRLRVKASELWKLDTFFWRCLWQAVRDEYERGVLILRKTRLDRKNLERLVSGHIFGRNDRAAQRAALVRHRWEGAEHLEPPQVDDHEIRYPEALRELTDRYSEELGGDSALVALNVITDLASNFVLHSGGRRRQAPAVESDEARRDEQLAHLESVSLAVFQAQRSAGVWLADLVTYIEEANQIDTIRDIESDGFGKPRAQDHYELDVARFLDR